MLQAKPGRELNLTARNGLQLGPPKLSHHVALSDSINYVSPRDSVRTARCWPPGRFHPHIQL